MIMMQSKSTARCSWPTLLLILSAMVGNEGRSYMMMTATAFKTNPAFLSQPSQRRHGCSSDRYDGRLPITPTILLLRTTPTIIGSSKSVSTTSTSSLGMFTGIVEEMGTVVSLQEQDRMTMWDGSTGTGTELVIQGKTVLEGAYLG